jgi:hypothetical protein
VQAAKQLTSLILLDNGNSIQVTAWFLQTLIITMSTGGINPSIIGNSRPAGI